MPAPNAESQNMGDRSVSDTHRSIDSQTCAGGFVAVRRLPVGALQSAALVRGHLATFVPVARCTHRRVGARRVGRPGWFLPPASDHTSNRSGDTNVDQ